MYPVWCNEASDRSQLVDPLMLEMLLVVIMMLVIVEVMMVMMT